MTEYRIENIRFPIKLFFSEGTIKEGDIFLGFFSAFHEGREEVKDVLNQKEEFLPIYFNNGPVQLINKTQLLGLSFLAAQEPEPSPVNACVHDVTIQLINGTKLEGKLIYSLPSQKSRVKDFLDQSDIFFELKKGEEMYLVNRAHILFVEEKDEDRREKWRS